MSKKQPVVTLSTTEAEYIAAAACACQCIWMQQILKQIGGTPSDCVTILCDNSSTIKLARNPVFDKVVDMKHCGTNEQIADIMTKSLRLEMFEKLRTALGVRSILKVN